MTTLPAHDVEGRRPDAAELGAPAAWRAAGRRGRIDLLARLIGDEPETDDAPQIDASGRVISRWPVGARMWLLAGLCIAGWAAMIALGVALSHI